VSLRFPFIAFFYHEGMEKTASFAKAMAVNEFSRDSSYVIWDRMHEETL